MTNTGTATINGWTVTLTLPGHTVTGSWNTVLRRSTDKPSRREECLS